MSGGAQIVYKEGSLSQEEIDDFDVEPLLYRVIVKELAIEKIGSIYIPDNTEMKRTCQGWVVAVGPGVDLFNVGQEVFYGQYSGAIMTRGRNKYMIMNEKDILGIVKSPKEGATNG